MSLIDKSTSERVRELNDAFRTSLDPALGQLMITAGVDALPAKVKAEALEKMQRFDAFTEDNDPYGEHDFGSFEIAGRRFFFKLDYCGPGMEFGSDDPSDSKKTVRVLTLMLTEEY